ncbi:MAG: DNA transfer protein p32 [Saprospiraceae bacterium]
MAIGTAAAIMGGASLAGGLLGSSAAKKAARTQAAAADRASQLQYQQFQDQSAAQEPFRQAGLTSQNELLRRLGLTGDAGSAGYGSLLQNFGMQQFQADPGYAFRLAEGQKALERQAAARGGLISGAALKAAARYGQDMGSQEYMNAFNRYQTERGNAYGMLSGQQGVGQAATNAMGMMGQNYANQAGNAYMDAGNARASGYVGAANALTSGLGNAFNFYQQDQLLKKLTP